MAKKGNAATVEHLSGLSKSRQNGRKPTASAKRTKIAWLPSEALEITAQTLHNLGGAGFTYSLSNTHSSTGAPVVAVFVTGVYYCRECKTLQVAHGADDAHCHNETCAAFVRAEGGEG